MLDLHHSGKMQLGRQPGYKYRGRAQRQVMKRGPWAETTTERARGERLLEEHARRERDADELD
eukprot:7624607-Heterocapsa_arctica.AAC.1